MGTAVLPDATPASSADRADPADSASRGDAASSTPSMSILGMLRVCRNGRQVPLGPPKQQLVLGLLLCRVNYLVPVDDLMELLWDGAPPRSARKNLQVYVSTLRGLLGARVGIAHRGGGYLLEAGPAELDWLAFEQRVRASQPLWQSGDRAVLARALTGALALCHGPVLHGMRRNPVIDAAAQPLESRLLTVFEDWAELMVAGGLAQQAIERITAMAARHPFRERLRIVQLSALAQLGRRTEALGVYDELRRGLASEFGLTPGGALAALHAELLSDAPALLAGPGVPAPRQAGAARLLPRDPVAFAGRGECLDKLAAAISRGERVVVLAGPAGTGKTTLAVHAAHLLAGRFADGCLFARMRADTGGGRTARQIAAQLTWWVADAGTAREETSLESWRRWLAAHQALVVLDDARREGDVRALLPESGESVVIVTARARLTGLGPACRLTVPPLRPREAVDLLREVIGAERVGKDPVAAEAIGRAVGLLPLGVRIAADKLASLPHLPLREYLDRLSGPALLDELTAGDVSVRSRFAQAAADLPAAARAALGLLGTLPSPRFTLAQASQALRVGQDQARRTLETLLEAGALTAGGAEAGAHAVIYQLPLLGHACAREAAGERRLAVTRSRSGATRPGPPQGEPGRGPDGRVTW